MDRYKNLGGNSNVATYEIGHDSIKVQFFDKSTYLYTYQSAGAAKVEQMKLLAMNGKGLNSYIKKIVNKQYAEKWIN
jgi:hypothetical protein